VGIVTASAIHFFEAEATPDASQLRIVAPWKSLTRVGLRLDVNRKLMSERLSFTLLSGEILDLDGMFTPKSKERPYQAFIDVFR
jgi:hypothetical protein